MDNSDARTTSRLQVASLAELANERHMTDLNWLGEGERVRYQAINSESRKTQYLAGHYLIRKLAGHVFENSISDWNYYQASSNIRLLKSRALELPDLHVSISHSDKWVAAAVSPAPIGVDIECLGKHRNFMAIAGHMFSDVEIARLKQCNSEELQQCFYLYWTLKESAAKQHGLGLKRAITRQQWPVAIAHIDLSNEPSDILHSWQCLDYVLSVSLAGTQDIETNGLQQPTHRQRWRMASI